MNSWIALEFVIRIQAMTSSTIKAIENDLKPALRAAVSLRFAHINIKKIALPFEPDKFFVIIFALGIDAWGTNRYPVIIQNWEKICLTVQ